MSFTSVYFLPFLAATYLLFLAARGWGRWAVLLAASLGFYLALGAPHLLLLLAAVTLVSYVVGLRLPAAPTPRRKKMLLAAGVLFNLAVLFGARYAAPLSEGLRALTAALGLAPSPLLKSAAAVGVSFYAFQAIAYLVNVYQEEDEPERHFGRFALYMSFFPKLLQGPIERPSLLEQLRRPFVFNYENARSGALLFAWGLFKKLLVADRLAIIVNFYYGDVTHHEGLGLLFATYLYAFQLYYDFSGYSDMAVGAARLFNIELIQNFRQPYLAASVAEFWRRWHISFSSWLQDYVFAPLQWRWRRWKTPGTLAALLVTFLASGVWHGASWGFVVWGLIFGLYMMVEALYAPLRRRLDKKLRLGKSGLARAVRVVLTFNLVSFAWIFFRAGTLSDALYVATHLFSGVRLWDCAKLVGKSWVLNPILHGSWAPDVFIQRAPAACLATLQDFPLFPGKFSAINAGILLVSLLILAASARLGGRFQVTRLPAVPRWLCYLAFALWLLFGMGMLEAAGQAFQEFLYFRF